LASAGGKCPARILTWIDGNSSNGAASAVAVAASAAANLVSVTALGATTAASYAFSGLVDWRLAGLFMLGGAIGGLLGIALGQKLSTHKRALSLSFSGIVIAVGIYVVVTSLR